jgi:hypothetical protein
MPKGKLWRFGEPENLAKALVFASTNSVTGTGQKSAVYWASVKTKWDELSPEEYEPGTFKDRSASTLKNYWNDHLHPQINKFQQVLTKVLATQFTGNLTEDQKINIAVAYYTKATQKIHYDYRDFDSKEHWKCFNAWYKILRHQPKWARQLVGTDNAPNPPVNAAVTQLGQRVAAAAEQLDSALVPWAPNRLIPPPPSGWTAPVAVPAAAGVDVPALEVAVTENNSGTGSSVTGSSEDDDPLSVSAKKRGGFLGHGKGKLALKKSKKDEEKAQSKIQVESYMNQMVSIAKSQADTNSQLSNILAKNHQLEERSKAIQEAKLKLKFAKSLDDRVMFEEAKEELKTLLNHKPPTDPDESASGIDQPNFDTLS